MNPKAPTVFDRLGSHFNDFPEVVNENVFTAGEYAAAVHISDRQARTRLVRLLGESKVRRVVTIRNKAYSGENKRVLAWEYLGK